MPTFATTSPIIAATLWLLVAFSVVTWTLVLVKATLQVRLARQNGRFQRAFWGASSLIEAAAATDAARGPLARLAAAGFACLRDAGRGARSLQQCGERQDVLERTLRHAVQGEQHRLESGLIVLASIGSTAPFVGLFGTVWGIMHALQDISQTGQAGLDVVAGPIGEALIATAIGIATAIPAVLAYNYGLRRLKLYVAELDGFATDFLHLAMRAGFEIGKES
jgi:biopolymer transport protein ExbB